MKKLYYTVERGLSSDGETIDGTKSAQVYSIENNEPKIYFNVHMDLTDNTVNHIKMHMEENDIETEGVEFIIL
jgi:hypothetical protein